jgi:hypothetical protein
MSELIFGRTWKEIQAAQQGTPIRRVVPPVDHKEMKATIEADIARFGLAVHESVQAEYNITIPGHYELVGDTYRPTQQPTTPTLI